MAEKNVYLVCNAHLDPVWQWEWEEGAAETLSTFRTAADLCEEFDGFIFNHNEALLYRWIEQYEPALFERIRRLVRAGKWNIMGGWHVQPDCNMPSAESFIRQALSGKRYFKQRFGVDVTTGINFDPFGHTRGLVQILAKSGSEAYLFCRPAQGDCPLPADQFVWVGYDGSEILATRQPEGYNSALGKVMDKVRHRLEHSQAEDPVLILWGVGNHGGGPSREDLQSLAEFLKQTPRARHATPRQYFAELSRRRDRLPRHAGDINPWAVGCYTSQVRVKQTHRALENDLYSAEKMCAAAWAAGLMDYPAAELEAAQYDLLTCEFHDILPGSSIQPAEEMALRMMGHGREILSRVRAQAFFSLSAGQPKPQPERIPIMVYNPHPWKVRATVECECNLFDACYEKEFTDITVHRDNRQLPAQVEKEMANIPLEWRKRVVFEAVLEPSSMNRFDCGLHKLPQRPVPKIIARDGRIRFVGRDVRADISTRTGLLQRLRVGGRDVLRKAGLPLVIADNDDPWGMTVRGFPNVIGRFRLMNSQRSAAASGVKVPRLPAVRVIEDGPVRTVVEAMMEYEQSVLVLRYKLPKADTLVELDITVHWQQKDQMLKLALPTPWKRSRILGEVAAGVEELPANGDELVSQKWQAVVNDAGDLAMGVISGGAYGSSFQDGELRLSLLRSAGYTAHPVGGRTTLRQDRFTGRIDQGERHFRFYLTAGPARQLLSSLPRRGLEQNEKPMALSFCPSGAGQAPAPLATLSDDVVVMTAAKPAQDGQELVIRLFEPTGKARTTTLSVPAFGVSQAVRLGRFEIKTLRISRTGQVVETDLLERPIHGEIAEGSRSPIGGAD
jgi:alpha-mannosidase